MLSPDDQSTNVRYGRFDRLLHNVALGFTPFLELSFDIETAIFEKKTEPLTAQKPVFICGLARSGTSLLLRKLHETGGFSSLTYRDLPFPLAPNLYARLQGNTSRQVVTHERSHGDGLTHDLESPEAIEELFWGMRCHKLFRRNTHLSAMQADWETTEAFKKYVKLIILRYGRSRYLSKNNNNILRLSSILAAFPDAHLVHPFRSPLQHAASLLNQHNRTKLLQKDDPFRLRFMQDMGHFEFGLDHRPFELNGKLPAMDDPQSLDYWLGHWIYIYTFLLSQDAAIAKAQIFFDYDHYCLCPETNTSVLLQLLAAETMMFAENQTSIRQPTPHHIGQVDHKLLQQAEGIHRRLLDRSIHSI
jgi:hypothetical protein